MNFSSSWYSVWRPGYLEYKYAFEDMNLLKEYRCPDLHGKLNVTAVIDHIVERLLHIGSKMCPIFQNNTWQLIRQDKGKYGSLLSRKLVRKSSTSVVERAAPWESRVSLKVALKTRSIERNQIKLYPFHPDCFFIMTSRPIKMCSLSYMTSGRAFSTSGGWTTWMERCLDLMRIA